MKTAGKYFPLVLLIACSRVNAQHHAPDATTARNMLAHAESLTSGAGSNLVHDFSSPPQHARPQIRFWTPGAAVTESGLREDIRELAHLGFGGFEIVAFAPPKGVGAEYAWGTDTWNRFMNTAADEAGKNGLTIDFTNGPKWPIAMPGIRSADDPGALYEMTYGSTEVGPGQHYQGFLPARRKVRQEGKTKLVALLGFRKTGERTLDASSVIDLTASAKIDATDIAKSTIEFSVRTGTDSWILFSFWEQPAGEKNEPY